MSDAIKDIARIVREDGWTCEMHEPDERCQECRESHARLARKILAFLSAESASPERVERARAAALGFSGKTLPARTMEKALLAAGPVVVRDSGARLSEEEGKALRALEWIAPWALGPDELAERNDAITALRAKLERGASVSPSSPPEREGMVRVFVDDHWRREQASPSSPAPSAVERERVQVYVPWPEEQGPPEGWPETYVGEAQFRAVERERDELRAEVERLKRDGSPGVLHEVDEAFYDLAIKERDAERRTVDCLRARVTKLENAAREVVTGGPMTPLGHIEAMDRLRALLSDTEEKG